MAYLENNVLKLEQSELEDFLSALIETKEIDAGECLGDVHDEWLEKFARQAFEAAGLEFTWDFKVDEAMEKVVSKTVEDHFAIVPARDDSEPL